MDWLCITRRTAFHLYGFQTIDLKDTETLIDFYTRKLLKHKKALLKLSNYLVVDAFFSKYGFVNSLSSVGFHIVSRLRDDTNLRYLFVGKQQSGRGRNKKYDGKVSFQKLNNTHANLVSEMKNERIYSLKVYSIALKRTVHLVIAYTKNKKGLWKHKNYFSTDVAQNWKEVLEMYRLRFQIEFLYCDAKQHNGLNDC